MWLKNVVEIQWQKYTDTIFKPWQKVNIIPIKIRQKDKKFLKEILDNTIKDTYSVVQLDRFTNK